MTRPIPRRLGRLVALGSLAGLATPFALQAPMATAAAPAQAASPPPATVSSALAGTPSKDKAIAAADAAIRRSLGAVAASADEAFIRQAASAGPGGRYYVLYQRSWKGLPVIGADAIVTADETGAVRDITRATDRVPAVASIRPTVGASRGADAARALVDTVDHVDGPDLVIYMADGRAPRLAWHVRVEGERATGMPAVLEVHVDARTGKVISAEDLVREATGHGHHNGTVSITTTGSGSSYSMTSTSAPGLKCQNQSGTTYTDADNVWGNGSGTDLPTACVDAQYGGEQEELMLAAWAGRNGVNGSGGNYPARVGLADVNAYWNGSYANFGHNQAGTKQATPMDVVAHEFGHGVFQFSGGSGGSGNEAGGLNESTGDVLGAATEFYANNASDPGDYLVGEEVDLVGQGPIRNMYDPAALGDPSCYSSDIPNTEVHAAAGPQNHWFYLLAEGSNPGGGKPSSPICAGGPSSVTGIGIQKATNIFLNGLQRKTSPWTHAKARVATLQAAKDLYPGSCTEFNTVKSAWLAVAVGPQSSEPTCTASSQDFAMTLSPTSGSVAPGSSATATVGTTTTSGSAQSVTFSATGLPTGATAAFSPTTVTSGASATMSISTASSTPAGTYTVTVLGDGAAIDRTVTYTLTVTGGTPTPTVPDVDVEKVKAHLSALQSIATSNGGNRRAGSAGYTASVTYVKDKLTAAGFTVTLQRCTTCTYPSDTIIADWPGGDPGNTYLFGAHLDSVSAGAGMNDNASGSAAILETALAIAQRNPTMAGHLRFAWWTDEEQGLNGSEFYARNLTATQRSQIKAYYNFDMVASTNGGYFINHLTSAAAAPMKAYWDGLGLAPEENTEGAGRSDDYSFEAYGIPTSGYAMGASARKTSAQAVKWGGTAGAAYDSCYHSSCDTYPSNVNTTGLNRAADGIAHTAWTQAVGTDTQPGDDFSVSVSPTTGSVAAGSSTTATVRTAVTSGSAVSVTLSASGLPAGVTASFSPATVTAGGSSTMTITASSSTSAGTTNVSVTGTGGGTSHSASYGLTVTSTGSGCSGYDVVQSGTVSSGATTYLPYVYDSTAGLMTACLDGPTGVDFDLYLQKWNGSSWSIVASATSSGPDETLSYSNTAGYYRLAVKAYSGSGSFTTGLSG
ncbi:M28 family peptidase [Intrasporangium sp. DVR]|uniref:M28 family peptidase n=1 Tax=Intrasporangium sp. DVR TaxID=3127867 RepID=UPI0033411FFE